MDLKTTYFIYEQAEVWKKRIFINIVKHAPFFLLLLYLIWYSN